MKRLSLFAVIMATLMVFAACSPATPSSTAPTPTPEATPTPATSPAPTAAPEATPATTPDSNQFISVEDAKALIDSDEDVVVFGVLSAVNAFLPLTDESSPIDGSYRVWRSDYSGGGTTEAISPNVTGFRLGLDTMNDLMSKAGVTEDSTIIVYSTNNMHDSTRFGWQMELMGLEPLYLDGGLDAWKAAGYDTGDQVTLADEDVKSDFASTEWNTEELAADINDVVAALENPSEWVVIDTRSQGEYDGEETGSSAGAYGTGALKGAVHIEWKEALNEDKTLKSVEELEALYGDVIEGKKVITFCQSGVRSSHTQMVLREMLGVEEVYNYDGSWIEWSYAASTEGTDVDADLKAKVLSLTEKWTDNEGTI